MSYLRMVVYQPRPQSALEAFEEAFEYSGLNYASKKLGRYGLDGPVEVEQAVQRAVCVCKSLGLPVKKHFRYFYQVDMINREVRREWKMSKLGFYLALCNGAPANPYVAAFQMEMLREIMGRLE